MRRQGSQLQSQKPLVQTWMFEDGAKCRKKDLNTEGVMLESANLNVVEFFRKKIQIKVTVKANPFFISFDCGRLVDLQEAV